MKDAFCRWHRYQRVKVHVIELKDPKKTVEVVECPVCDSVPSRG